MARLNETLDLRTFHMGLHSNPDQEDIPAEAQAEGSYNLEPNAEGKLKGIKQHSSVTSYGAYGTKFGWIERNTGEWDLIYTDGSNVKVIYDFYGTPSHATLISGTAFETIISNNQEVHLGMGKSNTSKWIGYVSHGQFSMTAPSGLQIENAEPTQPSLLHTTTPTGTAASAVADTGDAKFPPGFIHEYGISFIYDGYQESPIGLHRSTFNTGYTNGYTKSVVTIKINNYGSFNDRITGVKLYRRSKQLFYDSLWTNWDDYLSGGDTSYISALLSHDKWQYGEFKLVADIDINHSDWTVSTSDNTDYEIDILDENQAKTSYEKNTGIGEDNTYNSVGTLQPSYYGLNYGLATVAGSYLFATNAKHQNLPDDDAAHMIFRSKSYRYDTFDWANDKLIMPTIPKAMKPHRGLLYVWDENNTYIIEPQSFQIIKTITGRGCASQESVVETDYGLYWANKNGVYWSTQTEELIKPNKDNLSDVIRDFYTSKAAVIVALGNAPIVTYNSTTSQVIIHLGSEALAYQVVQRRWDYYDSFNYSATHTFYGAFIGKEGETYTVTNGGVYKDYGSSSRYSWMFVSKEFTLDDPSQYKKFYSIISDYSGSIYFYYSINGGTSWVTASTENISAIRSKTIKLKISGNTSAELGRISITYRRLRGIK